MKRFLQLSFLLGVVLCAVLVLRQGVGAIYSSLRATGWGVLWLSLFHVAPLALFTLAWSLLFQPAIRPGLARLLCWRWVGESVNNLLPVAQVGGDVVRARLARRGGAPAPQAAATVIADYTAGLLTQIVFVAVGLACLVRIQGFEESALLLAGFAAFVVLVALLCAAQSARVWKKLWRSVARRLSSQSRLRLEAGTEEVTEALSGIYGRRRAFLGCCASRMLAWFVGTGEVYLALWFLGRPLPLLDSLLLESVGQAVRSVAFFVPGAWGVQEATFVLLGASFGLGGEQSLSLSLLKRARELVLGFPGLLAWYITEVRSPGASQPRS